MFFLQKRQVSYCKMSGCLTRDQHNTTGYCFAGFNVTTPRSLWVQKGHQLCFINRVSLLALCDLFKVRSPVTVFLFMFWYNTRQCDSHNATRQLRQGLSTVLKALVADKFRGNISWREPPLHKASIGTTAGDRRFNPLGSSVIWSAATRTSNCLLI